MQMSQYAAKQLSKIRGVKLKFQSPFFKEFVVNFDKTGKTVAGINEVLKTQNLGRERSFERIS